VKADNRMLNLNAAEAESANNELRFWHLKGYNLRLWKFSTVSTVTALLFNDNMAQLKYLSRAPTKRTKLPVALRLAAAPADIKPFTDNIKIIYYR